MVLPSLPRLMLRHRDCHARRAGRGSHDARGHRRKRRRSPRDSPDSTSASRRGCRRFAPRFGSAPTTPFKQLADLVRWADGHSPVGCTVQGAPANTLDSHRVEFGGRRTMITLYFRPRLPALTSATAVLASEAIVADGRKIAQSPGKAAPPKERRYVELREDIHADATQLRHRYARRRRGPGGARRARRISPG